MDDRRVFERINVNFPLRFLDPDSGREGEAQTLDISANGVGFVSNEEILSMNTALEMWLQIPDQHTPLYTRGTVVWSQASTDPIGQRVGVALDKAEFMGLGRVLWLKRRASW